MAIHKGVAPTRNFIENLHYMDCNLGEQGIIRIYFKAIPNSALQHHDPKPEVSFVCASHVIAGEPVRESDNAEVELDERMQDYFNTAMVRARAMGVAKSDWKPLKS